MASLLPLLSQSANPYLGGFAPVPQTTPSIKTSVYQSVLALADKRTDILNPTVPTDGTPDGRVSKQELLEARQTLSGQLEKVRLFKSLFSQFGGQYGAFFNQYFNTIEQKISLQSQAARVMTTNFERFKAESAIGAIDSITNASLQEVASTDGDAYNVSQYDIQPIWTLGGNTQPVGGDLQSTLLSLLLGQAPSQNQGSLLL